ncbi:MAG: hypothetical protein WBE48_20120, partial [Xanthobacteraceae bacterium]
NSLNVFGTTGAIGTAGAVVTAALAEVNGNRLAKNGATPAAARPSVKRLRVGIPCMKDLPKTPRPLVFVNFVLILLQMRGF